MPNIQLTMAMNDYDHIRDLASGVVRAEGIEITALILSVEEIFFRMIKNLEFHVSEMSFGKYCSTMSQPNLPFVGIPVFPSRIFRQSAFFINRKGKVKKPEDLKGKRIGIPEWSQTATIYARGWIQHQLGIALRDITWVQSGINDPGRLETAKLKLPEGVSFTPVHDRSLAEMLLAGDIDAVITAHPPRLFEEGHPDIVRLFPDYRPVEEAYFKETGVYPIMHTVAVRSDVYEKHPWALMSLLTAFEQAK
ncbi:MAG: 4,5-dihydroxyphthalate decarboxylase, partial [Alphaproteobacteria bacterium]|nr:4,5-dihydroxyphthalate decarboxylase [Alphaproteobacteria bacterium]